MEQQNQQRKRQKNGERKKYMWKIKSQFIL